MNSEIFLKIVGAILTILCTLVTGFVIPWLKSKFNETQLSKLDYYLNLAVRCANQIYTNEQWQEKKVYVTRYITDKVYNELGLTLTSKDIDVLIEGVVNQVKGETK